VFTLLQHIPSSAESPDTILEFVIWKTSKRFHSLHTWLGKQCYIMENKNLMGFLCLLSSCNDTNVDTSDTKRESASTSQRM